MKNLMFIIIALVIQPTFAALAISDDARLNSGADIGTKSNQIGPIICSYDAATSNSGGNTHVLVTPTIDMFKYPGMESRPRIKATQFQLMIVFLE